jgi:hypothetical protein
MIKSQIFNKRNVFIFNTGHTMAYIEKEYAI